MSRLKTTGIVGGTLAGGALLAGSYIGPSFEQDLPVSERCYTADEPVHERIMCSPKYVGFIIDNLVNAEENPESDFTPTQDTTLTSEEPTATTTSPETRSVYVVGDSIGQGVMNTGSLGDRLVASGWDEVRADVHCGRPVVGEGSYASCDADGSDQLKLNTVVRQPEEEAFIRDADVIVTFAGTNDYWRSDQEVRGGVAEYMSYLREINPTVQIYWVDTYLPDTTGDSMVNDVIAQSGAEVIDYSSIAGNYYSEDCSDGIHPCSDGYEALAELVIQNIS